jgi:predicted RNase H-like nuclease (RuvC/YqgF family)
MPKSLTDLIDLSNTLLFSIEKIKKLEKENRDLQKLINGQKLEILALKKELKKDKKEVDKS